MLKNYKGATQLWHREPPAATPQAQVAATCSCLKHAEPARFAQLQQKLGVCLPASGYLDASLPVRKFFGVVSRKPCTNGCMVSLRQFCAQYRCEMLLAVIVVDPANKKKLKTRLVHFTADAEPRFIR